MTTDLLGHDRYARHLSWRASGRIEGDTEEDTTAFIVQWHDDRWLWTHPETVQPVDSELFDPTEGYVFATRAKPCP